MEETGRLKERKQYQKILSPCIKVSLPKYSNSITIDENER